MFAESRDCFLKNRITAMSDRLAKCRNERKQDRLASDIHDLNKELSLFERQMQRVADGSAVVTRTTTLADGTEVPTRFRNCVTIHTLDEAPDCQRTVVAKKNIQPRKSNG